MRALTAVVCLVPLRQKIDEGRTADARREAPAVLEGTVPSNPADWTVKDLPQAKALLDQMKDRS